MEGMPKKPWGSFLYCVVIDRALTTRTFQEIFCLGKRLASEEALKWQFHSQIS